MGMFSGNIGNSYQNNHVFIILDPHFQDYGVGSLTTSGFKEFIKTDFGKKVMGNRIGDSIMSAVGVYSGAYTKYNGEEYQSELIDNYQLLALLTYHESGDAQNPERKIQAFDKQIKEIQNSIEGYVGFKNNGKLILKCYFNAVGKSRNERVVTQKGSPLITATPRLPSGRKVSSRHSQTARQTMTDNFPGVGSYVDATKGGDDDVENVVTGPIRLSWNEVTGSWENANQQLARLITDLEPANIVGIELSEENLNTTKSSEYYSKTSPQYMGQRATGIAIPLSVQSNNPDMFGPNLIKCEGSNAVEQISVVNRSNDSFKSGDIILCSFMSGEWIAQKFGTLETKPQPTSIGRWGFTKLISNSDWYFRDGDGKLILPASCQDLLRAKFYNSLLNVTSNVSASIFSKQEISTLNSIGNANSNRTLNYYIQSSSFDNSGPTKGGTGYQDFYSRINVEQPAFGDTITYHQTPIFWGPVFPDGYSSAGHARMSANTSGFSAWKHSGLSTENLGKPTISNGGNGFFLSPTDSQEGIPISAVPNIDINDSNFLQLPADIATNGAYGGDGFPLEDSFKIMRCINSTDSGGRNSTFAASINNLINNEGFSYYLGESNNPRDMYGLKPINPLRLQFSSLCAELAGSDDLNSAHLTSRYAFDRNFRKNAREALSAINIDNPGTMIPYDKCLFGKMYERLQSWNFTFTTITPVLCGGVYASADVGTFQGIPYDCYIQKTPLNKPIASSTMFRTPENPATDGANLVGIITARNAFTKNKGGTMNVSVKQMFGMYGPFIGNGGGGSIAVTILGSIGAWTTDNSSAFKARYAPIFGSTSNDSIDSFGTTALHCMVWDYWPEQQTIFVPQYFSVLHFNPGLLFSAPSTKTGKITTIGSDGKSTQADIKVDVTSHDVDFRIPSYNEVFDDGGYEPVADGEIIDSTTTLAPENDWRVNTVRRGQLVTSDGFFYYKLVIGLDKDSATITDAGEGFAVGSKIATSRGVTIEVTGIGAKGSITSFTFAEDDTFKNKVSVPLPRKQGEGFIPSNFKPDAPYKITLPSPAKTVSAVIQFTKGKAYKQIKQDVGPKLRTPITRLSSSSGAGTARIEDTKNNTLNIEDNVGSKYPNKYEAFYFFHNDIGHTFNMAEIDANPNFTQYMTMTIS